MNYLNRRAPALTLAVGSLLLILLLAAPVLGRGPDGISSQTWPSRTPTSSAPPEAPATEPPSQPTPVATSQPGSTIVPTSEPAVSPTAGLEPGTNVTPFPGNKTPSSGAARPGSPRPESIQLPSAASVGDCGLPPLAVALGTVKVRSGPGIEHGSIAALEFQSERPIIGRAATSAWWQILLTAEQQGWVSDQAVDVVGYTGAVPIIAVGEIDGERPAWNPTPNPLCTPPSQEEIEISDGQLETLRMADSSTRVSDDTGAPRTYLEELDDDDGQSTELSPQQDNSTGGFNLIWLLIAGVVLIVFGALALFIQRR